MNAKERIFTKDEIQFFVEHESIQIIPNFISQPIKFITGQFGPFTPGVSTTVPLWIALNLKKKGKCRIITPEIYEIENLQITLDQELKHSSTELAPLEHYFFEIFQILAKSCPEDIEDFVKARSLVEDLKMKRSIKITSSFQKMKNPERVLLVKNFTNYELQMQKSILGEVLEQYGKLKDLEREKKGIKPILMG